MTALQQPLPRPVPLLSLHEKERRFQSTVVHSADSDNAEFKRILQLLKNAIPADKIKYTRMAA